MPLAIARQLLPPSAIIGVSCNTLEHARKAIEGGADYVGLGAIYATSTKDVSAPGRVCGIAGARAMLCVLEGTGVKAVAIGKHSLLPPSRSGRTDTHGADAWVAQAALNGLTCSVSCTAARLPLAMPSMASQSCQKSSPRLNPRRPLSASHRRSATGRR